MCPQQSPHGIQDRTADVAEYTGDTEPRHRERTAHVSSRSLRLAHFAAASAWGFVVGVAGLLVTLQLHGQTVVGPAGWIYLVPGLTIAIGGGAVIARAYQEAKRRRR